MISYFLPLVNHHSPLIHTIWGICVCFFPTTLSQLYYGWLDNCWNSWQNLYERDCDLGVPLESQTTEPQTNNQSFPDPISKSKLFCLKFFCVECGLHEPPVGEEMLECICWVFLPWTLLMKLGVGSWALYVDYVYLFSFVHIICIL